MKQEKWNNGTEDPLNIKVYTVSNMKIFRQIRPYI